MEFWFSVMEEKRSTAVLDSAKQNLASSFVNAFVNAGFCKVQGLWQLEYLGVRIVRI